MINLFVRGVPAAQPRVKAFRKGDRAGVFTPSTADGWKTQVALTLRSLPMVKLPSAVNLAFTFERPASHHGTKGLRPSAPRYHQQKPDVDNLAKSTLDAMVSCGFLSDDRLIVKLVVSKTWGDVPGCQIRLQEMSE